MSRVFVAALAVAVLAACAGTSFDWSRARQIRAGMTESELTALMGAPYLVKSSPDGMVWVWSYAEAFGGAKSVSAVLKGGKVVSAPVIPEAFK